MKLELLLMRHAKSAWETAALEDHERPLNDRGRHDAPFMGQSLSGHHLVPDLILCSDAVRASQTWQLVEAELGIHPKTVFLSSLYEANAQAYVDALSEHAHAHKRVLIIGHNPTLESLITRLSGEFEEMKPAHIAVLELGAADWASALQSNSWVLKQHLKPASE